MTKLQEQQAMRHAQAVVDSMMGDMVEGRGKRYKINEIFYTLQGEGTWAGSAAVFVRFSACNLACSWCDTEYDSGAKVTLPVLCDFVFQRWNNVVLCGAAPVIVLTGGEPSLQVDLTLVDALHARGHKVSMETNGIKWTAAMAQLDLITVSPKGVDGWWCQGTTSAMRSKLVFKVVVDPSNPSMEEILDRVIRIPAAAHFLQPLENPPGSGVTNVPDLVAMVRKDPRWRLSLQTHKILGLR